MFDTDEKVRFYTGLPSIEVLMKTFEHVAPSVNRKSLTLDKFQEFVIDLMKLRLNVPFQDLAYRFSISVSTASRIFLPLLELWMLGSPHLCTGQRGTSCGTLCLCVSDIYLETR